MYRVYITFSDIKKKRTQGTLKQHEKSLLEK